MTLLERFLAKIRVDDETGCWEWTAAKLKNGYGLFWFGGKLRLAHRASYEMHNSEIPHGPGYHGICVLHRCDNRACVNPAHLFASREPQGHERQGQKADRIKLLKRQVKRGPSCRYTCRRGR